MRHHSRPLYTPEPDVIHELIGHATSFFDEDFVRLSRLFGEAALVADAAMLARLERVYWYTLEFGLAREGDEVKAYGAGLLSSYGELGGFESRSKLEPFDLEKISRTPYDPTNYQAVLFVAPSFRQMAREVGRWLESVIAAAGPSPR
jgi:phenylalanine-4-hydroxylase